MSEENVELYRRGIEAFNRRDLEGFLALADPDVVGILASPSDRGRSFRGHDGIREWWNDSSLSSPSFRIEVEEVRDTGDLKCPSCATVPRVEGGAAPHRSIRVAGLLVALWTGLSVGSCTD